MDFSKLTEQEYQYFRKQARDLCDQRKIEDDGVLFYVLEKKFPHIEKLMLGYGANKVDYTDEAYDPLCREYEKADKICRYRVDEFLRLCVANRQDQYYGLGDLFPAFLRWAVLFLEIQEETFADFVAKAEKNEYLKDNIELFAGISGISSEELKKTIDKAKAEFYS